jgi:UDP:flavonoid glycosyltransferase YjiC (YdhE family)
MSYVSDPSAVTAAQVSEATTQVLEDPAYREAARRIAAEIAATPPPASLVPWLASLPGAV